MRGSGGEHQRALEAEGHPGRIRQAALERREQPLIDRADGEPQAPPLRVVALEALALLGGRRELVKAVGELDAVAVQLEAPRGAGILGVESRERRLARGVAVDEGEGAAPEAGAHPRTHEELEPRVAIGAAVRKAERPRGLLERLVGRGEGVEAELAEERVAIADALARALRAGRAEEQPHERLHLVHERRQRETDAVPLYEREFGVVQPSALGAAHHVTDLVDVATAGGEQPLHGVLGRGMQVGRRTPKLHGGAHDVHVAHRRIDDDGGVDLEHAAGGKELARAREERRAPLEERPRGAGPPVPTAAHVSLT